MDEGIEGGNALTIRPPRIVADNFEQKLGKIRQGATFPQNAQYEIGKHLVIPVTIAVAQDGLERGFHVGRGKCTKSRSHPPYGIEPGCPSRFKDSSSARFSSVEELADVAV